MTRKLAILATTLAALIGSLGAVSTSALADSPAGHSASCGWSTDGNWFYSPTYGEWIYYNGHAVFNGKYYRRFIDYNSAFTDFLHASYVYCG